MASNFAGLAAGCRDCNEENPAILNFESRRVLDQRIARLGNIGFRAQQTQADEHPEDVFEDHETSPPISVGKWNGVGMVGKREGNPQQLEDAIRRQANTLVPGAVFQMAVKFFAQESLRSVGGIAETGLFKEQSCVVSLANAFDLFGET